MVYIGMAAAIGQSCDIPALLRSMAFDLYRYGVGAGNELDFEMLLVLDSGTPIDDPTAIADSYYLQWWSNVRPPSQFEVLALHSIDRALDHHRSVTASNRIMPKKVNKLKYTWSRGCRQLSYDPRNLPLDCDRCQLYRGVSVAVLDNIQDLRHLITGFEVSYGYNTAMRRASGFFQLYEAAMQLESTADDAAAEEELSRLRDCPSLKWTWGPEVTEHDALKVFRALSNNSFISGQDHSGYKFSLPYGRGGNDSIFSMPQSPRSSTFSSLDDESQVVPELSPDDIPHHFRHYPLRNYQGEPPQIQPDDTPAHRSSDPGEFSWLQPVAHDFFPIPTHINPGTFSSEDGHDSDDSDGEDGDSIISISSSDSDDNGAEAAAAALLESDVSGVAAADAFLDSDDSVDGMKFKSLNSASDSLIQHLQPRQHSMISMKVSSWTLLLN
jgi:hypothetical protein